MPLSELSGEPIFCAGELHLAEVPRTEEVPLNELPGEPDFEAGELLIEGEPL